MLLGLWGQPLAGAASLQRSALLCTRSSTLDGLFLRMTSWMVVTANELEPYWLFTTQAASGWQRFFHFHLRLNVGFISIASLFSRACLAEPIMHFWASCEQAANQAKEAAGEFEKNVNWGWVGACQVHSLPWHLVETFCALRTVPGPPHPLSHHDDGFLPCWVEVTEPQCMLTTYLCSGDRFPLKHSSTYRVTL